MSCVLLIESIPLVAGKQPQTRTHITLPVGVRVFCIRPARIRLKERGKR